ncbi:MAG TPA: sigma-70 family RNA polymerase sigma factor [Ktedonobacteraceae bacterium]|nr:sigma-70 family RNA polymerase sigma factor [Ktedonobacteraceae bacterium]
MLSENHAEATSQRKNDICEEDLVTRAQRGETQAFEVLYERYSARIARHITSIVKDSSAGSELMQDTFIKVWERLADLRDPSRFPSWLYRIATNKAYNYQRHIKLMRQVSREAQEQEATTTGADLERQVEERELVWSILARMTPTYRSCLILYFLQHMPRQHISVELGIKISSIDKYLSRGKKEFRRVHAQVVTQDGKGNPTNHE